MELLRLQNVSFAYSSTDIYPAVLSDFNLSVNQGEFISIVGKSGCGKSTLLSLIAGLLLPVSGNIHAFGKPVQAPSPERMLMFQNPCLLPWLTVADNISLGCKLRNDTGNLKQRIEEVLALVELSGQANKYPGDLSAGMAQRVAFARSIIARPRILLLDESFASLDYFTARQLVSALHDFWFQFQMTVLFVIHDLEEAIELSSRIIVVGGSPATIQVDMPIDIPYPRLEYPAAVGKKYRELIDLFSGNL